MCVKLPSHVVAAVMLVPWALQALLFGGVAFVSMVAANVPFITFCLELCRGKRPWAPLGAALEGWRGGSQVATATASPDHGSVGSPQQSM